MKERTEKAEDSRPWKSALFYQAGLQPHRDIIGTQAVGIADLWVMLCLEQNWAAAQWGFSCFVKATSNFKVILKKTDRMLVSISEILAVRTNRCQWQHPTADTECRVSCPQVWYTVPLGLQIDCLAAVNGEDPAGPPGDPGLQEWTMLAGRHRQGGWQCLAWGQECGQEICQYANHG